MSLHEAVSCHGFPAGNRGRQHTADVALVPDRWRKRALADLTAVSAVCVTGLVVVDTGTYWSGFGQPVIMVLFQLGGFGMMTASTLLGLLVNSLAAIADQADYSSRDHTIGLGDVTAIARLVLVVTLSFEMVIAVWLASRLHLTYALPWPQAAWNGLFHSYAIH